MSGVTFVLGWEKTLIFHFKLGITLKYKKIYFFRLGLLDDLFALVKAGHTSTVEVLKLLKAFEDETDYNVWSSMGNILGRVGQLLGQTECEKDYHRVSL